MKLCTYSSPINFYQVRTTNPHPFRPHNMTVRSARQQPISTLCNHTGGKAYSVDGCQWLIRLSTLGLEGGSVDNAKPRGNSQYRFGTAILSGKPGFVNNGGISFPPLRKVFVCNFSYWLGRNLAHKRWIESTALGDQN
jgi:hypothetical protein